MFMFDQPLSVSEVNNYLRDLTSSDPILNNLWVEGEISNLKFYKQGQQWYFSLKDEAAQINCVVFASHIKQIRFTPEEGMQVSVKAKLNIFNKRGTYNLMVFYMEPSGIGAQLLQLQQLTEKLKKEGLLDRKRNLPQIPLSVAVITSPTGAAISDIIETTAQRFPLVRMTIIPAIVQGDNAPASLVKALQNANKDEEFELIIISRGGGSREDLSAFNDEQLAREVYRSKIPVVSAVGHEIDTSLVDLVADLRVPTPSAVAEMIFPDIKELLSELRTQLLLLNQNLQYCLNNYQLNLNLSSDRLSARLKSFNDQLKTKLNNSLHKLLHEITSSCNYYKMSFKELNGRLSDLNPLNILERGYTITRCNEHSIKTIQGLKNNDIINTLLPDGHIWSKVIKIQESSFLK